ncbi:MAG TPA: tetratricopeptide repeat protein [Thermoanaerobaculia bacterium]|nr:tetratricopeptide repeat protein [Thermoanaerobaculia bacterium]
MRHFCAILALALLASTAAAATTEEMFAAGKKAFTSGELDKAVDLFEKAVKAQPANADYHYWLGNAYGRMAQSANLFKQASLAKKTQASFERAVALDPIHLEARYSLLEYYMIAPGIMGGSEEKALQQASEIKKRDTIFGHRSFARIYTIQKKPDLARKEYLDAIRDNPASAEARHYYGMFLTNQKDYKAALDEFESAARMEFMPAYFRIGVVAVLSESALPRGEEALKKYLAHTPGENEPSLARAWYWLGQAHEKQGRRTDARNSYARSLQLAPGAKDVTAALKRVS